MKMKLRIDRNSPKFPVWMAILAATATLCALASEAYCEERPRASVNWTAALAWHAPFIGFDAISTEVRLARPSSVTVGVGVGAEYTVIRSTAEKNPLMKTRGLRLGLQAAELGGAVAIDAWLQRRGNRKLLWIWRVTVGLVNFGLGTWNLTVTL